MRRLSAPSGRFEEDGSGFGSADPSMHSSCRVRPCAVLLPQQQQQRLATLLVDCEAVLQHIMCLVRCVWHHLHKEYPVSMTWKECMHGRSVFLCRQVVCTCV